VGNFKDNLLISDTGAINYYIKGDKVIWTEGKEDLKKRLGRSCDDWDAFVYAWWARCYRDIMPQSMLYTSKMHKERKTEKEA